VKKHRIAGLASLLAITALALAACSGGGRTDNAGAVDEGEQLTIAVISHGPVGDTFFDILRKGAEAAGANVGAKILWSSDADASEQSQLIQQAIDQKVDGIAVSLPRPDALKDVLAKATAAGIPWTAFNAGGDKALEWGAAGFFGQDEKTAGQAVGTQLAALGVEHPLCVEQEQGNVSLDARCAGITEKIPGTEVIFVNGTDLSSVTSTLLAKLQASPDIDAVTATATFAVPAVQVVKDANSSAIVAAFDLSAELAASIQDGGVAFTVDQQPYLQTYQAVEALWLYNNGLFSLGGGAPVATGPAVVDKTNVDQVVDFANKGLR